MNFSVWLEVGTLQSVRATTIGLIPKKIQTQFETLEERPETALSYHEALFVQDGVIIRANPSPPARPAKSAEEVKRGAFSRNLTRFFRNVPLEVHPKFSRMYGLDIWVGCELGFWGGSLYEENLLPAVYRIHDGGLWAGRDKIDQIFFSVNTRFYIAWILKERGEFELAGHWKNLGLEIFSKVTD